MQADRLPPQDIDSERAFLGGVFYAFGGGDPPGCDFDELQAIVGSAELFYVPAHREVWKAMVAGQKAGEPLHPSPILARLEAQQPEGDDCAETLRDLLEEADAANLLFYARQVRRAWQLRELIVAGQQLINAAYTPTPDTDPNAIIAATIAQLEEIDEGNHADREATREGDVLLALKNPRSASNNKVPVAIGGLGDQLDGGFELGTLTIVGARPSCGKTSLGLGLCLHASRASDWCASLFASCEMTERQIGLRALSMRSGLSMRELRSGAVDDHEFDASRNLAVLDAERGHPIYVLDSTMDARAIAAHARRYARKHAVRLIIVDYLQLCDLAGRFERHDLKIGAMTAVFKKLARETNTAVVVLSQLSRASERENRAPRLCDLRDSGSLEQDADNVILIRKGDYTDGRAICDTTLIVAKQRQGDTGEALVCYRKPTMSYEGFVPEP